MHIILGVIFGLLVWFLVRYLVAGLYTVDQNERAIKTSFGRAQRLGNQTTLDDPLSEQLTPEERERYDYPQVRMIPPGGLYFKWPWAGAAANTGLSLASASRLRHAPAMQQSGPSRVSLSFGLPSDRICLPPRVLLA